MAMGKQQRNAQDALWVPTAKIAVGPGSPFYVRLNRILDKAGFDRFVENACEKFYVKGKGRPGVPPGVYFRMLLIGYFEGITSERGIAWRCADSLTLREFLGYGLTQQTPDHTTLSVIRQRIDVEMHQDVFTWILVQLANGGLLKGKTLGIDATTLEANAAMRSIVRRDDGRTYDAFLTDLAKESGIETPTRKDLAKCDKKRKKKASNDDWEHPNDPDAKIAKMKDGRTHLAHKAEHVIDMQTQAIVAVTIQPANRGDTTSIGETLSEAMETMADVADATNDATPRHAQDVVGDKGYHSNDVLLDLAELELRSYISEPDRGRRRWKNKAEAQSAVYANRRRIKGNRGKRLMKCRGEVVERPFAHCYETGGLRRTTLRQHANILKRVLIHAGACNLGLLMRTLFGNGTPRAMAGGLGSLCALISGCEIAIHAAAAPLARVRFSVGAIPVRSWRDLSCA